MSFIFLLGKHVNTHLVATVDKRDTGNIRLEGFPGADLCGTFDTTKSTSGGFFALVRDNGTFVQLDWFSKKQTATSHSTTEAEMVALPKILREVLVPQIGLWKLLMGRTVMSVIHEDK